jgi:hypothetical protein
MRVTMASHRRLKPIGQVKARHGFQGGARAQRGKVPPGRRNVSMECVTIRTERHGLSHAAIERIALVRAKGGSPFRAGSNFPLRSQVSYCANCPSRRARRLSHPLMRIREWMSLKLVAAIVDFVSNRTNNQ